MSHWPTPPRLALALSLFLLACLSALPLLAQENSTASITGEIRVARATFPSRRLQVTLITRGVNAGVTYADNDGRFSFPNLPGNVYHILIRDADYEPVDEVVELNPQVALLKFVQITLTPRPDKKPEPAPAPPASGGNPYMVSAADYNHHFPKKVIKEFDAGVEAGARQRPAEAIKHFEKALALAPDFYPAHNNLGSAYLTQGDLAHAQSEFAAVVRLNPSDAMAYFNLGNVLYLGRHYDEALQQVQEGLRRQPNSAFGFFVLGEIYTSTNRLPEAERALRQAATLDANLAYVRLQLVKLYLDEKRNADAVAELKAFLKAFPQDPLAPKAQHLLNSLESQPQSR
jgi:Tfp pilus assembly protein PilF